jgi:hypothetical protein
LKRLHGLVQHDFMALVVNLKSQVMGFRKSRQDGKGHGNAKFQKRPCMAEGHPYVVNDQGDTGSKGWIVFRLFRGKGLGESIEPKETSNQKGGTFQQKAPTIHGVLLL